MIENTILAKNRRGLKSLTFQLTFPNTMLVELAARAGFDGIHLDGEHGAFSPESVDLICRVANGYGMSVMARVPSIEPSAINLWLDRGVQGVMGPHIESGEEARRLADACYLPPDGWRSWGGGRGNEFNDEEFLVERYGGKLAYARWANANMFVIAQIESKRAYENLDEILAVPGITAVGPGPNDFAASLGHPGEPEHPERRRLTADVEARARRAGKRTLNDMIAELDLRHFVLLGGKEFVRQHHDDRLGE